MLLNTNAEGGAGRYSTYRSRDTGRLWHYWGVGTASLISQLKIELYIVEDARVQNENLSELIHHTINTKASEVTPGLYPKPETKTYLENFVTEIGPTENRTETSASSETTQNATTEVIESYTSRQQ